jgi:hypothetical protein
MLSNATCGQIMRFTDQALREIGTSDAVDRVTVIRGYMQMLALAPNQRDYRDKISGNLRQLSELAVNRQRWDLAQALATLAQTVDREGSVKPPEEQT